MRKLTALLTIVLLLTATVCHAAIDETTTYDKTNSKIVIEYSGYANEEMAVLVYDVTGIEGATKDTLWESLGKTPIIGIDQSVADGSFEIPVASDFTGSVVILLSGGTSDTVRMLMNITEGIPDSITVDYDAKNEQRTLADGEQITIAQGATLRNAMIDASLGQVVWGNTTITGNMLFDASGSLDAALESTVKLQAHNGSGGINQGFIKKHTLSGSESNYTVTLRASGTADGKTYNSTKDVVFDFGSNAYTGTARFKIIVKNVPEGITIAEE